MTFYLYIKICIYNFGLAPFMQYFCINNKKVRQLDEIKIH